MAPRKSYRRKRTYRKKKSTYRRKSKGLTSMAKIYSYKLQYDEGISICVAGTSENYEATPSFGDLPQFATFAALYDQYRITSITLKFTPAMTQSTGPLVFPNLMMYTVLDYNDANALSTTAQATQHNTCRMHPWLKGFSRTFKPHVVMNVTDSAAQAYVLTKPAPWISTANTNIQHLGVKMITDVNSGSGNFIWNVNYIFTIQFKNVK